MRHLVNVGKTNPNKPKVKIGKMNITSFITMSYEQRTMNDEKNKPKQSQNAFIHKAAEFPAGELLGIFKPGTKQTQSETCPARIRCELIFNRCGILNKKPVPAQAGIPNPLPTRRKYTSNPSTAKLGVLWSFRPYDAENRRFRLQFSCFKVLQPNNR